MKRSSNRFFPRRKGSAAPRCALRRAPRSSPWGCPTSAIPPSRGTSPRSSSATRRASRSPRSSSTAACSAPRRSPDGSCRSSPRGAKRHRCAWCTRSRISPSPAAPSPTRARSPGTARSSAAARPSATTSPARTRPAGPSRCPSFLAAPAKGCATSPGTASSRSPSAARCASSSTPPPTERSIRPAPRSRSIVSACAACRRWCSPSGPALARPRCRWRAS